MPDFEWAPYGNVAAAVHDPAGNLVCIVGLPAEGRLATLRNNPNVFHPPAAEREQADIIEGRDANIAWAQRIADALNATPSEEQTP